MLIKDFDVANFKISFYQNNVGAGYPKFADAKDDLSE